MHLYQAGMPLALLTEWLGHADPETTLIYAHADTEMKRHALEKANSATTHSPLPTPLWHCPPSLRLPTAGRCTSLAVPTW